MTRSHPIPRWLLIPLSALIAAVIACGQLNIGPPPAAATLGPTDTLPPAATATVTPTPAPTGTPAPTLTPTPLPVDLAALLIDQVSSDRLMATVNALADIPTRNLNSTGEQDAAAYIFGAFSEASERLHVAYDTFSAHYNGVETVQANVIATLPGSDPSAGIVILGAHYDSRTYNLTDAVSPAPGADDNASGVAAVLEAASLLANLPPDQQLAVTVEFVAFAAEETGPLGSQHYVEQAQARGDDIRAVIVLDMVGNQAGPDGEGAIRVFSAPPADSPSRLLAIQIDQQASAYLPDFDVQVQDTIDREGRFSDHVPFSQAGYPAVRLIEAVEDPTRNHTPRDLPNTISPGYLKQATQLALISVVGVGSASPGP